MNHFHYRQEAYRLRSHPESSVALENGGFAGIYWSLLPFIGFELMAEASLTEVPGGILFPMGFFLYWAFYFTYYRPGSLEAQLSAKSFHFSQIPAFLVGGIIWLIKVCIIELGEVLLFRWWSPKKAEPIQPQVKQVKRAIREDRPSTNGKSNGPAPLPDDVIRALSILGLTNTRDWNEIHRRYRELAKKFHPDLNPNLTSAGTRFMTYDAAYRKLENYKVRYFTQKAA